MKRHLSKRIADLEFGSPRGPDSPVMTGRQWEEFRHRLFVAFGQLDEPAPAPGPVPTRREFDEQISDSFKRAPDPAPPASTEPTLAPEKPVQRATPPKPTYKGPNDRFKPGRQRL